MKIIIPLLLLSLPVAGQDCCFDPSLISRDTSVREGIYLIEPKPGFKAEVKFVEIPPEIHEDFITAGSWTNATNTGDPFLNKTVSYSNAVGSVLTLNFYGSKIEIVTAKDRHHGIATVQINNGPETPVDLYSSVRVNESIVYTSPVPFGTNTIKVKVTGQKNTLATGTYIVIDYFKVYP